MLLTRVPDRFSPTRTKKKTATSPTITRMNTMRTTNFQRRITKTRRKRKKPSPPQRRRSRAESASAKAKSRRAKASATSLNEQLNCDPK